MPLHYHSQQQFAHALDQARGMRLYQMDAQYVLLDSTIVVLSVSFVLQDLRLIDQEHSVDVRLTTFGHQTITHVTVHLTISRIPQTV